VELASRAAWAAAGEHSALALAMLFVESKYGTAFNRNSPGNKNALNLRPPIGGGYLAFPTWAAGVAAWRERLTSATYKGGIYARTTDLLSLISDAYAPASDDNDPGAYVALIVARFDRWGIVPKEEPVSELQFGNVAHPPFVDRLIPDFQNGAWDDLGQRTPIGIVQHTMVGTLTGTDGWFRRGAASNGLTDYGVGLDGTIYRWNDPLGRPVAKDPLHGARVSANRAGWANGGSDGLEGDGVAFVRKRGVNAINRDLISIERDDRGDVSTPMSDAQFEAICRLAAYWFDFAKVPYDQFPLNPAVDLTTWFFHLEFALKGCPHPKVVNRVNELQNRQRAILKAGQTAIEEPDVPPVKPPVPDVAWPNGWSTKVLARRFGSVTRVWPDGREREQGFNERGSISNAWAQRGAAEGITDVKLLPRPAQWLVLPADKAKEITPELVVFDAPGLRNWVLYRPDESISWKWMA
jgi:hypothetical protein